jgi:Nuclease-related domain
MDWFVASLAVVGLVSLVALLGYWLRRCWWLPRQTRLQRKQFIANIGKEVLFGVMLPDGHEGFFHVDALLLTDIGVVVLDIRDWDGMIYGAENMHEWTVMHRKGRYTIPNPLSSLYDRIAVIRPVLGEWLPVQGRVLFGSKASFPKGRPHWVSVLEEMPREFEARPPAPGEIMNVNSPNAQAAWQRLKALTIPSPHRVQLR